MKKILHGILSALLHGMARLPFWALYAISDVLYFVVCYVVRYRKKMVVKNLRESFPEKDEKEVRKIAHEFYRNFTDYIVETIKLLHISDKEMKERFVIEGADIADRLFAQNKSIVAYFSHCFNWEYATSFGLWSSHTTYMGKGEARPNDVAVCWIYRPLKDKWFDALMLKARGNYGISVAKKETLRFLIKLRREGIRSITGFMSDQKPSHGDPTEVVTFLNHPTAMITGTETLLRRLGMAVVYFDLYKLARGRYKMIVRLICEDPNEYPVMGITRRYAEMLEETIRRNPAIWLWSHNRWKIPVTLPQQ